jgi:hypothetical protein
VLALAGSGISLMAPHEPGTADAGLIVTGSPVVQRLRRMIIADGVNIRPCGGGRLMIWSGQIDTEVQESERASGTWCQRPAELAAAAMQAAQLSPGPRQRRDRDGEDLPESPSPGRPARHGMGTGAGGLYVIAAHAAVTLAPALAELFVAEVSQKTEATALDGFRPDRFARAQ